MAGTRSLRAVDIGTIALAVVLAAEVARITVASAVADEEPTLALRLVPNAPAALAASAMGQVGAAAARGGNPDESTFRQLRIIAQSDPLRTEPFLVEAAMAERRGAYKRATRLLTQARFRDPRSVAARYLYADTAIRQGRVVDALKEMAVLSRLVPGASIQLVPALAQFARSQGSHNKLAAILAENPQLKNPLLLALATDPDNASLIISLAGPPADSPDVNRTAWQSRLLLGLITRGDYQRAHDLWRSFARVSEGSVPLIFNGNFGQADAPPPFNWVLSSSSAGISESRGGKLRVLYYGRQDATLANQLLVLRAGRYRFMAPFVGDLTSGVLSWSLDCVGSNAPFMELKLGTSMPQSAVFTVPATGCPAQSLQLNAHLQDSARVTDIQIGPVSIERAAP